MRAAVVTTRLGVLGWPVAHSRSPAMHNAALRELGLDDWRYQHLPVPPERLAETVRALHAAGFRGANVTIPHKEAALALATSASARARADRRGEHADLRRGRRDRGRQHGCSGADRRAPAAAGEPVPARSCSAPVAARAPSAGRFARPALKVSVWNRTPERAEQLAADLGIHAVRRAVAGGPPGQLHQRRAQIKRPALSRSFLWASRTWADTPPLRTSSTRPKARNCSRSRRSRAAPSSTAWRSWCIRGR